MRRSLITVLVVAALLGWLLFVFMPDDAYAHGSGLTLTATTTVGYVDVDFSDYSVYAHESGRFDLKLFKDADRTSQVPFTRVWVRIVQKNDLPEGETIFSGWIAKPSFGPTGFSITLPTSGEYRLMVRYVNGDTAVEDVTLPFTVIDRSAPPILTRSFAIGAASGIGSALGALSLFLLIRRVIRRRR